MTIPESVRMYNEARWWYCVHFGLPAMGFYFLVALWQRIQEYREDVEVDKPRDPNPLRITPKD